MTDTAPPKRPPEDGGTKERLMALEIGLRHFQQICEIRQDQLVKGIEANQARNRLQAERLEVMEERLLSKVDKLRQLIWSGLKWLAALLATATLTIVLKALSLI